MISWRLLMGKTLLSHACINFESDAWHLAHAKDLDGETKLIEAGFEYVRYSGKDEVAIYRKRK